MSKDPLCYCSLNSGEHFAYPPRLDYNMASLNGLAKEEFFFPTIDISDFENRKTQISSELGHAAREIGFFRVTGTYSKQSNPASINAKVFKPCRLHGMHRLVA